MKGALTKKAGPLPIWAWAAIAVTLGYIFYRYQKNASSEEGSAGVEEGFFPTQGIPYEGAEVGGEGGISGLEEARLKAEEAADIRHEAGEERKEERAEGRESRAEAFQRAAEERKEAFERWAAEFARGESQPSTKGGEKKPKKPGAKKPKPKTKIAPGAKNPNKATHVQPTNHKAAAHPSTRVGVAQGKAVRGIKAVASAVPAAVAGAGGGVAQIGGAGGASGGVAHPNAYSSGIGAGHPKPAAPSGYHAYKGANGQWWFAPN